MTLPATFDRPMSSSYSRSVLVAAHPTSNKKGILNMGYIGKLNANKVVELEQQDAPTEEQIEELQLTETEQAELDAE